MQLRSEHALLLGGDEMGIVKQFRFPYHYLCVCVRDEEVHYYRQQNRDGYAKIPNNSPHL